jgi:RHH-type rel operon transcriptional repressor/antitoxin RelB
MFAIRLPKDIETRLDRLAKQTGRSKNFHARAAILKHPEDLEDLHQAEQTMQRIQNGQERTYTWDEVEARLGLAD